LLDALMHDSNPGVRVEVVNMLVRSLERQENAADDSAPDLAEAPENSEALAQVAPVAPSAEAGASNPSVEKVIRTLEELQKRDPNRYVRLRSAAALRQIGPRDLQ
jgi:hypothetical protein